MTGQGVGQLYIYGINSLHAIVAGGYWDYGVNAGSRCVYVNYYPWYVNTTIGCRFACDCL